MEITMKDKIKKVIILIAIILGIIFIKSMMPASPKEAHKRLEKYLKKEYKEEFVISYFGARSRGDYEAVIYPKSYIGTRKQHDKYYEITGYYDNEGAGDNYKKVLAQDDTNEYFRPKLEELFGKNILSVFQYSITWEKSTFEELKEYLGDKLKLDGAIYIFGTINDEDDIRRYQKGIFDFVQHLKAEEAFEYTKIAFIVIDERVLEDDFYNLKIKEQLIEAKKESETEKEFLAKREKLLSQVKITKSDKSERIEGINRGGMTGNKETYFAYPGIAGTTIISKKMLNSDPIYKRIYESEIGKTYDEIEEVSLGVFTSKYLVRRK